MPASISAPSAHGASPPAGRRRERVCRLGDALRDSLGACECKPGQGLSRAELAFAFDVSAKTVARWEDRYDLPISRENARVLRYPAEAVVMLCAAGLTFNRDHAYEVGLAPDAILAVAAKHSAEIGGRITANAIPINPVMVAATEDERRLLRLWQDPVKREALTVVIRAMAS